MAIDIGEAFKIGDKGITDPSRPEFQSIGAFLTAILPNIYIISGVILFILFIGAGFAIMTSSNDPEKQNKGMQALAASLIGFIIIFVSYWIIQIIEILTGVPILKGSGI